MSVHLGLKLFKLALAADLTQSEKSVLFVLSDFINNDPDHPDYGKAWPSHATIGRGAGIDARTVRRAIRKLKGRGVITTTRRNATSSTIEIRWDALARLGQRVLTTGSEKDAELGQAVLATTPSDDTELGQRVLDLGQRVLTARTACPSRADSLSYNRPITVPVPSEGHVPAKEGTALRAGGGTEGTTQRLSAFIKHEAIASLWTDLEHRRLTDESLSGNRNRVIESTTDPSLVAAKLVRLLTGIDEELHRFPSSDELHAAVNHDSLPKQFSWGQLLSSKVAKGYKTPTCDRFRAVLIESMKLRDAVLNASVRNEAERKDWRVRRSELVPVPPVSDNAPTAHPDMKSFLASLED